MQWRGDWSDQKARKIGEIVSKQKISEIIYLSMNLSLLCTQVESLLKMWIMKLQM